MSQAPVKTKVKNKYSLTRIVIESPWGVRTIIGILVNSITKDSNNTRYAFITRNSFMPDDRNARYTRHTVTIEGSTVWTVTLQNKSLTSDIIADIMANGFHETYEDKRVPLQLIGSAPVTYVSPSVEEAVDEKEEESDDCEVSVDIEPEQTEPDVFNTPTIDKDYVTALLSRASGAVGAAHTGTTSVGGGQKFKVDILPGGPVEDGHDDSGLG